MNPPPQIDHDVAQRALDTVEFGAKVAIALGAVWAFVTKIATPYSQWRRKRMAEMMREVLAPELQLLNRLLNREDDCTTQIERALAQITELFGEHDLLLDVALDNRARHDETNELLDAMGFSSDRRADPERRQEISMMLDQLSDRRKSRRRKGDPSS